MVQIEAQSFRITDYPIDQRLFHVLITNRHTTILTAVRDDLVMGYVCLVLGRRAAHIYSIAVRRHYRGRGIGTRLLEEAEDCARTMGAEMMRLEVRLGNRAVRLYQRKGYAVRCIKKNYYGRGLDAYCMEKLLQQRGGDIEQGNTAGKGCSSTLAAGTS